MGQLHLTNSEVRELQDLLRHAANARQLRRAQVLLALQAGERPSVVGQRVGLTRQAVYHIAQVFQARASLPVAQRLLDQPRSGRPARKASQVEALIREVFEQSPRDLGYAAVSWTAPLLRTHLWRTQQVGVHERTVRRVLRRLNYRYKRPRYVLARRAKHWRQAKGG